MAIIERVRELVEPLVNEAALTLYDVEYNGGVVRVLVDRPEGLDLDSITGLSRSISRALDENDPIPGRYTLEVSSPGLERPLRTPAHFQGAIGNTVKVKTNPDHDGPRRLTGELVESDDESIRIRLDSDEISTVPLAAVSSARTVFEWGPQPKPGGSSRRTAKKDREATPS